MDLDTARVADYFVICGLNANSHPVPNVCDTPEVLAVTTLEYVTGITAIKFDEKIPPEYIVRKHTVGGHRADFKTSEFGTSYFHLCYKKSRDLDGPVSPIAEIRVFLTDTNLPRDFQLIDWHSTKKPVNFGYLGREVYLGFRTTILHAHTVAITDLNLISVDKGEVPPPGFKRLKKNLDNHLMGKSKIHLCYRLAMPKPKAVFYTPEILSYYPTKQYPKDPLDPNIISFCMPAGVSIEVYDEDTLCPLPTSANFVFTSADGLKSYGVAVTLYEPVPEDLRKSEMFKSLNVDASKKPNLFMCKAIVITSKWPFFSAFRTFLTTLYRISISKSSLPLERYIYNFMKGVPFPKPDGSKVMMQIGPESIFFSPPVNTLMPLNTAPFHTLLQCLNPKNIITLLHLVLLEQKIVLLSSVQSTLISVAESIQCLLYPFQWQTPYIPYILDTMTDMLDAPFPFIFGIHSLDFDVAPYLENPMSEVSFVDLDSDYIYEGISLKELTRLALPKGPCKVLKRRFTEIRQHIISMGLSADDLAVDLAPINITARVEDQLARIDLLIQDAMLRFTIQLFNPYRSCLIPPTSVTIDHNECFNRKAFLQIMSKSERGFYTEFFDTQMFQKFIQDRFTDVDNNLNFFDVCIKKINDGEGKDPLIEYFQIHADEIVRTEPVSGEGLPPDVTYSYNTFPNMNMDYFPEDIKPQQDLIPTNFSQQLDATRVLKDAVKYKQDPYKWPRFLLGQCYSLWFLYLPTFIQNKTPNEQINIGNECLLLLEAIRSKDVLVTDEVAYLKLMELGSEQRDLQLVQNVWKELERGKHESSTNIFTLYSKALDNCYTRRAQLRWKKSIFAIVFCIHVYNKATIAGGSPFNKSLAPRGDMRRRVLRVKKKITLGSFYPDRIRFNPMNRDGNDVMIEDEEFTSDLTIEVMKQVVIDPTNNTMLDSDSEDSLFNPASLSPSPPPPEPSRHTPSPISILTLPPTQILREAKKYFKHTAKLSNDCLANNLDSMLEPIIRVSSEYSDAAFINKAMAPKISDRRRSSIENELESSMVLKTVDSPGMINRLSNSQILTSKDSGFTEFTGSKGAIDVDRKEFSSADNLTDSKPPYQTSASERLILQRSVTSPNPKLTPTEEPIETDVRSTSCSPLPEAVKKSNSSPRRAVNPTLSSSPESLDSMRTDSSSGQTSAYPLSSLIILMSSSTSCPHCMRQVYDEEIVSMWAADDIDFRIKCNYCTKEMIPKITILIQEAIVKEQIQKKPSMNIPPTKTFKALFRKSLNITSDHSPLSRKSSITLPHNPVDASVIPTAYTFAEVPDRLTNVILEDTEHQVGRFNTDLEDDATEIQGSYDDSGVMRVDTYGPTGGEKLYQHYRSYTSGVKTMPKRIRSNKPKRPQVHSTYNLHPSYLDSSEDVHSRIQSVCYDNIAESISVNRGRMSTGSSVFSLDNSSDLFDLPLGFDQAGFISEDDQSMSQYIRDNLEGTDHILFNKDGKDNCLPDEGNIPFIGSIKNDKRLSVAFFSDDDVTTDPYLSINDDLASKLESMPLRSVHSRSGSSTPNGRGSPADSRSSRDYISIPYLSPLVLRKSLENLINKEGYEFLNTVAFVKRSPFIYWNLLWYFQRLGLRSNLQDILLKCAHYKKCYIELLWEPIGPEVSVPFLHSIWRGKHLNHSIALSPSHNRSQNIDHVMQNITTNVECLELVKAARHILNSRKKDTLDAPSPSLYREMLFLFLVLTKDALSNLDTAEKLQRYDRHYKQMMSYLPKDYSLMLSHYDNIPCDVSIHCRKIFGPLRIL